MESLTVALAGGQSQSYNIHIGQGLLHDISRYIPFDLAGRHIFVLADENVEKPYARAVCKALKDTSGAQLVEMMALPAGEQTKSFDYLQRVCGWMLGHGVRRDSVLFAVGGGVIGDLGGLAASLILRGIAYVQVPTTLLAQVDSSVGGKTAIDTAQGKNLVGAFYQPAAVICDLDTLQTLPRRQMQAGYAETVKYGLINDPEFFIWLEASVDEIFSGDVQTLSKVVRTACSKKAEIVIRDEKERGERALLNLGHTFAHSLELAAGYETDRLLHGEAVSIGIVMAFHLSYRMGVCDAQDIDRIENHLAEAGLPTKISMIDSLLSVTADELISFMQGDKKMTCEGLRFILVKGIGRAFICDNVRMDDVRAVLQHSLEK